MAEKKLLTYEGLEEYNIKWHERLQAMTITDDNLESILLDELDIPPAIPENWTVSSNGTLDISLSNAYSYWPEGAGTKTISITNGTSAGLSKFFLKLTDAGNFFVEWGSNIQWKDGSEPEWQTFHEDIILFRSNDGGSTWTAQVLETNEIDPYWKITIKTETANQEFPIPFDQEYIGSVDWGDGSTDISTTITGTVHYGSVYFLSHTYTNIGTYKIIMTMPNGGGYLVTEDGDPWYFTSKYMPYVISIDSPLPSLSGTYQWPSSYSDKEDDVLDGCFAYYQKLLSIPEKLLWNNPNTPISDCFYSCSSLTSIPSELFNKHALITSFYQCFTDCSSLQSIPSGLFDKNTAVTSFGSCFCDCSSIQSIPAGLFDKNTAVTSFYQCFYGCTSLTDFTLYIGSQLVSNCTSFVTGKANTTRTIYVPANSTTKTTFDAKASSLGLTIIGE